MNIAFRLLLTFNATSLLVIIFLVQKGYTLKRKVKKRGQEQKRERGQEQY